MKKNRLAKAGYDNAKSLLDIVREIVETGTSLWWRFFDWLAQVEWRKLMMIWLLLLLFGLTPFGLPKQTGAFIVLSFGLKVLAGGKRKAELEAREATTHADEEGMERRVVEARMAALQAQVEPHFLFNTLANLRYLIRTDADAAQQMLDHLVGYLQNALPDMRSVSSTVQRELDLARAYLSIMQIRMGERLQFLIDAEEDALAMPLPPAMLISLVENAVKHGLERASRPGVIVIAAEVRGDSLRVTVRDNGIGLTEHSGQGFGLANIHQRLALLYGARASLTVSASEPCGVDAVLTVPQKE